MHNTRKARLLAADARDMLGGNSPEAARRANRTRPSCHAVLRH
jgi:hypothetical protein